MSLRYVDRKDVLEVIMRHPGGITTKEVTRTLWPDRQGCEFTQSYDWTKHQIHRLHKAELIQGVGSTGKPFLWKVRP